MLTELVRRLRVAGLGVSIEELEDILWLAERLPVPAEEAAPADPGSGDTSGDDVPPIESPLAEGQDDAARLDRQGKTAGAAGDEGASIYSAKMSGTVSASVLRVPGVASTEHPEDLRRALQPFARRVPSRWRSTLDEEETATQAADTGVWCPVYKPVRERWFDLSVVIESSSSMALWDDTLDEFMRLLRNQGGFRSVTRYWLDGATDGQVLADDRSTPVPMSRWARNDQPHIMLFVSDATSARWRSGHVHAFLCEASGAAAVSLLQPLPRRSWRHTAVGEPEVSLFAEKAGDANAHMKALLPWWLDEGDARQCLRVPVIGMDTTTIRQWAGTMTARGGAAVPGVLLAPLQPAVQAKAPVDVTAAERVARYRAMVSRDAYELAVFLSVPDPLTIPVMRLVQRTMLPATGTAELAEFFVGGLIRRMDDGTAGEGCYRFIDGVREELTKSLRYSEEGEIQFQLRSVGKFLVEEGSDDHAFEAFFPSPTGRHRITQWSMPFAEVSRRALAGQLPADESLQMQAVQEEPDREARPNVLLEIRYLDGDGSLFYLKNEGRAGDGGAGWGMKVSMELIQSVARRAMGDPEQLQYHSDRLVPLELAEELAEVSGTLVLLVESQLQSVPWELLLWTRRGRRRELVALTKPLVRATRSMSPLLFVGQRPLMLVIGDPAGTQPDLPAAQDEATEVAGLLHLFSRTHEIRTDLRSSLGDPRSLLRREPFRLLFLSGHGVRRVGPSGDAQVGLQFGQADLLTVDDILVHQQPPEMVVLAGNYLADMATQLLHRGVSIVLAPVDAVDDRNDQPKHFIEGMVKGLGAAQAMLEARKVCFERRAGDSDIRWGQYALFGNPDYRLASVDQHSDSEISAVEESASSEGKPLKAVNDSGKVFDERVRLLFEACMPVPNRGTSSGVHTAVWFGSDLALTCATRSPEGGFYWREEDSARLAVQVFAPWASIRALRDASGPRRLFADDETEAIANREWHGSQTQILALIDDGHHSGRHMHLAEAPVAVGVDAEVLFFVGSTGMRCTVKIVSGPGEGRLHLRASPDEELWPLPPEAHGAPVVVGDQCVGMILDVGDAEMAVAFGASTIRAAIRSMWRSRLQFALGDHQLWLESDGHRGKRVSFPEADFSGFSLENVDLRRANLPGARFTRSLLFAARFDRGNLPHAQLDGAILDRASFASTNLAEANLQNSQMNGTDFSSANMSSADVSGAFLPDGVKPARLAFVSANLASANLQNARVSGSDFSRANMSGADLRGALVDGCQWSNTNLSDAKFDRAHASDESLRRALGISLERFIDKFVGSDVPWSKGEKGAEVFPMRVLSIDDVRSGQDDLLESAVHRFIAAGDSWFRDTVYQPPDSLLHSMAFTAPCAAVVCDLPGATVSLAGQGHGFELADARRLVANQRWTGLLLSLGGDHLFEMARTPAVTTDGSPVPPDHRLLLTESEWRTDRPGGDAFISPDGFVVAENHLMSLFDHVVALRDSSGLRGLPIFLHGYATPVPRPSPASDGNGPWLQPTFAAYGIPIEHHAAVAQALVARLRALLARIASDTSRYPNVHYFDPAGVKLRPAGANQPGVSGDWATELHPSQAGYAKLARAWSDWIGDALKRSSSTAA
ncbi:SAV_2336 N-terminal domain-related protein [Piscinibacter terrae]|uniref:CHAT domain-containing protein n=1 Tax=Piscinibacter terrae TaxID=2496871 RepID=A0A3N7HJE9_9BURK|nr:SAV_2336 N-terminal domain-related protein [Albitalea terrae]RQP22190.1 CHAT domain-containing protein [Albitalea terrae]